MFETLFGNKTAAKVLVYLDKEESGYANEISRSLKVPLNMVQKQLDKFERGGILASKLQGKTKWYFWNLRWPLRKPFRRFLSYRKKIIQNLQKHPADGTSYTLSERLILCEELTEQAEVISPFKRYQPFTKTFESRNKYEAWRKKQKNPWLA